MQVGLAAGSIREIRDVEGAGRRVGSVQRQVRQVWRLGWHSRVRRRRGRDSGRQGQGRSCRSYRCNRECNSGDLCRGYRGWQRLHSFSQPPVSQTTISNNCSKCKVIQLTVTIALHVSGGHEGLEDADIVGKCLSTELVSLSSLHVVR